MACRCETRGGRRSCAITTAFPVHMRGSGMVPESARAPPRRRWHDTAGAADVVLKRLGFVPRRRVERLLLALIERLCRPPGVHLSAQASRS